MCVVVGARSSGAPRPRAFFFSFHTHVTSLRPARALAERCGDRHPTMDTSGKARDFIFGINHRRQQQVGHRCRVRSRLVPDLRELESGRRCFPIGASLSGVVCWKHFNRGEAVTDIGLFHGVVACGGALEHGARVSMIEHRRDVWLETSEIPVLSSMSDTKAFFIAGAIRKAAKPFEIFIYILSFSLSL